MAAAKKRKVNSEKLPRFQESWKLEYCFKTEDKETEAAGSYSVQKQLQRKGEKVS